MDGIARDQHAGEIEQSEQRPGGGDLVAVARDRDLTHHQPRLAGEGGDDGQRRRRGGTVERAAQGLAIDRQHAAAGLAEAIDKLGKAGRKRRWVEQPEQS